MRKLIIPLSEQEVQRGFRIWLLRHQPNSDRPPYLRSDHVPKKRGPSWKKARDLERGSI